MTENAWRTPSDFEFHISLILKHNASMIKCYRNTTKQNMNYITRVIIIYLDIITPIKLQSNIWFGHKNFFRISFDSHFVFSLRENLKGVFLRVLR